MVCPCLSRNNLEGPNSVKPISNYTNMIRMILFFSVLHCLFFFFFFNSMIVISVFFFKKIFFFSRREFLLALDKARKFVSALAAIIFNSQLWTG
ncbi:unnamed protein product [Coffea canephora]|uniref:Uncharacterized protein n=1 Tax=Coffea canephora TaxID=49390 RepID=A0A068VDE5_COFCA|nr:unnamed protein product [Coffea canephora]